jgi:hypothetical protein
LLRLLGGPGVVGVPGTVGVGGGMPTNAVGSRAEKGKKRTEEDVVAPSGKKIKHNAAFG